MPPDLQYLLGEMNAKLDTLIQRTNEDRKASERLEQRVTKLEALRWTLFGAASALGGTAGLLTRLLAH